MDNLTLLLIISVIILIPIVLFIFYLRKRLRKAKILKTAIPEDVLNDFQTAERMIKESNGTKTPEKILWEIYKSKSERRYNDGKTQISTTNAGESDTARETGVRGRGKRRGRKLGWRKSRDATSETKQEDNSGAGNSIIKANQPRAGRTDLPQQLGRQEDIQSTLAASTRQDERNIPENRKPTKRKLRLRWKRK